MSRTIVIVFCACVAGATISADRAWADNRRPESPQTKFEALIARIRAAAASNEWQQPGWKDEKLEAELSELVAAVRTTTGREFLKFPVAFEDVSGAAARRPMAMRSGALQIASGNVNVIFASKSIFLVDGSIQISHATDCIVVARGIVQLGNGNRNLVIAGHHVDLSHDGSNGLLAARRGAIGDPKLTDGSLVVSGGSIEIAHAHGTTCAASYVEISHARQIAFLGSPTVKISHQQGCSEHKNFKSPLDLAPPAPLPESVFKVKQIIAPDDRTKQLITVERNGLEYVLRPDARLVDETGQPLPGWTTWKIGFIAENIALFTNGETDMSLRLP